MAIDEPTITPPGGSPQMVPGYKWIRGTLDGQTVVDSRSFLFVWESPYWPWWFFPKGDIHGDVVEADDSRPRPKVPSKATRYNLVCAGQFLEGAARGYPGSPHAQLRELIAIDWSALDRWYEEDVEVFVHPRSPFTRVDALASSRHVVVSVDDVVLADSHKPTLLFETGAPTRHYLPQTDVNMELLVPSRRRSSCPYKGDAAFWSAAVGDGLGEDIAWSYTLPRTEALPVASLMCFFDERVDVDVDGARQPRPTSHFK